LLEKLDLPLSLFPDAVESDAITGEISAAAAELTGLAKGTPVVGGGGDAVIQTTGMGLIEDGVLGLILGTAGIVAMGMSKYQDNTGGKLQFFCNNASELYHVMGVSLAAGGSYQWYRNNLCQEEIRLAKEKGVDPYELMNADAEKVPPGSRGVIWLPYLSGERCPYSDPTLRAAFLGLSQGFGKAEMTRAVMEGVTYSIRQMGEAMKDLAPISMQHIIVSGGGSNSPLWRQILSDVFQLPVKTLSGGGEGGAYGAALVGGVGIGIWKNLAEACSHITMATTDEPNAANKAVYDEMYGIYDGMYNALKPMHDKMAKL
jgi:xylulokinase